MVSRIKKNTVVLDTSIGENIFVMRIYHFCAASTTGQTYYDKCGGKKRVKILLNEHDK